METLTLRALNYWRRQYLPTYVGLRLLTEGPVIGNLEYVLGSLARKSEDAATRRFRRHLLLKAIGKDGLSHFRTCWSPSPTVALGEAAALDVLSRLPAAASRQSVYSYRWPRSVLSGQSYSYFVDDYDARTAHVTAELANVSRGVACVFDVANFYPSIDLARLRARVEPVMATVPKEARALAEHMVEANMGICPHGVAVGPALSHWLAGVFLSDVDDAFEDAWRGRYTRYVDDIVVVCEASAADSVYRRVKAVLQEEGLELNERKCDVVDGSVWRASAPMLRGYGSSDDFGGLAEHLRLFLTVQPKQFFSLVAAFRGAGISLPLERFREQSQNARWHAVLLSRVRRGDFALAQFRDWFMRADGEHVQLLVTKALELRNRLLKDLRRDAEKTPPDGRTARRWYVQTRKKATTGLLYLLPREEYGQLLKLLPTLQEFLPVRQVVEALLERSLEGVLGSPGAPAATVANLWRMHRLPAEPLSPLTGSEAELESLLYFVLSGSGLVPHDARMRLPAARRAMIDFAAGEPKARRTEGAAPYDAEMEALGLGSVSYRPGQFLETRSGANEVIQFEASLLLDLS